MGDRSHAPLAVRPPRFFIAVQGFGQGPGRVPPGSLLRRAGEPPAPGRPFWAEPLEAAAAVRVPARAALELSEERARLLQAVTDGAERLALLGEEGLLRRRGALRQGDPVRVRITSASGEKAPGVLRYRGAVGESPERAGIIFGVELVGSAAGKGFTDGSFRGRKFFSCPENCGVFVPVSRVEPDEGGEGSPPMVPRGGRRPCPRLQLATEDPLRSPPLELGDRVFFQMDDSAPTGKVVFCDYLPEKETAGVFVGILLDQPVGSWDGVFKGQALCRFPSPAYGMLLPISKVHKEKAVEGPKALRDDPSLELRGDPPPPSSIRYPPRPEWGSSHGSRSSLPMEGGPTEQKEEEGDEELLPPGLEINSMVEVQEPPIYGVIRWIAKPPDVGEPVAGLELEEPLPSGCTDGIYRGLRRFLCPPGKALFVPLRRCRPDARFGAPQPPENPVLRCNSLDFRVYASQQVPEDTPPELGEEGGQRLVGWKKGIQGHCNSCYLDATLFCMFAFSSALDTLLLRPADKNDGASYAETRDLLRTHIVNPLRRHGYVCATKGMALRRLLEAAGRSPGFTCEEKDPEEFLTLLFRVLKVEPLFKIRSADKDPQGCIFYQIFPAAAGGAPGGASGGVPTVQQLLEGSLAAGDLKFTEAPSCLILQMPRHGRDYKAFSTIQPSLELDLTDLLEDTPRECCICQALARSECPQCYGDPGVGAGRPRQYCPLCCQQVHRHRARRAHRPRPLRLPPELTRGPPPPGPPPRQTMQLYAVLCIQTSHYVAFARHGPRPHHWLFFDSMADRQGGQNGFNIPRVTPCPEVADYLEMTPEELQAVDPKSLPPCARRLLCDAYMCLYHSPVLELYK